MMWTAILLPAENPGHHGVRSGVRDPHRSLKALAERYFLTQVVSQAEGTEDARHRDLPAPSTSTPNCTGMMTHGSGVRR